MTADEEKLQEPQQAGAEMYDGRLRPQSCGECRNYQWWGPEYCSRCLSGQSDWASPDPEAPGHSHGPA